MVNKKQRFYFGVDVETTGLNFSENGEPLDNKCLQIAFNIMDFTFTVRHKGNLYVKCNKDDIDKMNDYVTNMHKSTGLYQIIEDNIITLDADYIDSEISKVVDEICGDNYELIPFGNAVSFDVEVVRRHFPMLWSRFSFKQLDVSAIRRFLSIVDEDKVQKIKLAKKSNHDASVDLEECVKEYHEYLTLVLSLEKL